MKHGAGLSPPTSKDTESTCRSGEKKTERRCVDTVANSMKKKANLLWEMRNPAKRKVISQRRRARLSQAEGSFTAHEWEALKTRYGNICLRCGRGEPEVQLTPDHVVALAAGGRNDIGNIQPLCRSCNSSKGAKSIDYRER
jgi:5-methylcytosine-specific restriction endonuclease McrA